MSDKQEDSFTESFDVLHKAQAKNAAYKDLVAFLEKYDKKITRQFNELSKRYKRLAAILGVENKEDFLMPSYFSR